MKAQEALEELKQKKRKLEKIADKLAEKKEKEKAEKDKRNRFKRKDQIIESEEDSLDAQLLEELEKDPGSKTASQQAGRVSELIKRAERLLGSAGVPEAIMEEGDEEILDDENSIEILSKTSSGGKQTEGDNVTQTQYQA